MNTTTMQKSRTSVAWKRRAEHRAPEIIGAARALLEQKGYAAVSMARIAKRAGVSEATVYKYFKNKQELLNEVLREWATPFIEDLQREIVLVSGLRQKLTLIAIRYLRGMEKTPKLHRVVYQELRWSDYFGSPLHRLNQRFANIVVDAVEEAILSGEAASSISAVTVRDMLFGGLEHVAQRTIFAGRVLDTDAEATKLALQLVNGIAATAARETSAGKTDSSELTGLIERLRTVLAPPPAHDLSSGQKRR